MYILKRTLPYMPIQQPYYRSPIKEDNVYRLSLYKSGGTFNVKKARVYKTYTSAYLANILFKGKIEKMS